MHSLFLMENVLFMDWVIKLKKYMADNGVNIEQLKTKIEETGNSLSRNSISNIINGKNSPKIETLNLITNALGIELGELFSTDGGVVSETEIDGFIEYKGKVHRIKTKKDLVQIIEEADIGIQPKVVAPRVEETSPKIIEKPPIPVVVKRTVISRKSDKLTRHVFRRYNVTVCDKKELFEIPNELKLDTKIWVFRSREEALKAKTELTRMLGIKFNG